MKRLLALSLAAIMTFGLLTACGNQAAEQTNETGKETNETGEEAEGAEAESEDAQAESTEETQTEDTEKAQTESAGEISQVLEDGKLTVGTNAEFPPYEYHDGGEIVGIDVEVAGAIAEKMGLTLEIEDIAFDSIIPELQSGKADIGAAGMTVSEDRLKNVDFSDTYTTASQVIIVKEDSDIAGPDDLAGKIIGVQLGTTGDIYASDYEAEGSTIERYNKGFEAVQAMIQGKIDAVVIDVEPAKVFVSQNEGIKILDEALTVEEYAIAVKKGNTELLDQINGALAELKASGELQAIIDKYISAE